MKMNKESIQNTNEKGKVEVIRDRKREGGGGGETTHIQTKCKQHEELSLRAFVQLV